MLTERVSICRTAVWLAVLGRWQHPQSSGSTGRIRYDQQIIQESCQSTGSRPFFSHGPKPVEYRLESRWPLHTFEQKHQQHFLVATPLSCKSKGEVLYMNVQKPTLES